ncbi:MAG: ABC transporter permease [Nocardioides sp.]
MPLLVLGVFFVLPVVAMISRGFFDGGSFDPGAVAAVLGRPRIHRVLWFTLWSASAGTALSLALGLPAAHVLYRLDFWGRDLLRALVVVPFVLPTVVVGVAFRELIGGGGLLAGLGLDGSPVAIVAGLVFFNVSVVVRIVGSAWAALDPRAAQAAAGLGASPMQVLRTVTLPALRPAIVSAASVVFLFCATAFGVVLTLGGLRYASVETEIYLLTTNLLDLQGAAALSILQLVVVLGLLLVAGRARRTPDAVVARDVSRRHRPRREDLPAVALTGLLVVFVATPLLTLVNGSLHADGRWTLANYRGLGRAGDTLTASVVDALVTSLRTAVDATWMSLLLGLSVSFLVTRRSRSRAERRARTVLDGFFMLPLGVSAVTLGFGFLIALGRPPLDLRESPLLVPVAQALVALPLVVRTIAPVLAGVDPRLREAAASLGAGPLRAVLTVDLPALWRPLLAATGFAFAVSLGEFGATSFLARDAHPTLPVVIYRLLSHPGAADYGRALAASVVLAASVAVVMAVVDRLRVRGVGAF